MISGPLGVYRYFEELIATAIAVDAEANAPADEGLSETERLEVARLRLEVDAFSDKYEGILGSLREDEVYGQTMILYFFIRIRVVCHDSWRVLP